MIKANELRIGNFVYSTKHNREFIVTGLSEESIRQPDNDYDEFIKLEYLVPIELTKEWILKFGGRRCSFKPKKFRSSFKIKGVQGLEALFINNYWGGFEKTSYSDLHIQHPPGKDWFSLRYHRGHAELKFVHQLQNLFFALIGVELTIKEEVNS